MSILLGLLTFLLILVSLFMILVVLAQKAKSDAGMGAVLGGGVTEGTFGHETGNILSTATIYSAVAFFVLSLTLYLGQIWMRKHAHEGNGSALPTVTVPAAPKTDATTPAANGTQATLQPGPSTPADKGTTTPATTAPAADTTAPLSLPTAPAATDGASTTGDAKPEPTTTTP